MSNFQSNLCDLLITLAECPISRLTDMREGQFLSKIMRNIDSEFFPLDHTLDDWNEAQFIIERFLASKGIQDKSIEFEVNEILYGSLEQLVSALIQLVALVALFNPARWTKVISSCDPEVMISLKPILEPLIQEASEKFNLQEAPANDNEQPLEVTAMLRKMERLQSKIEESENKVKELRQEVTAEKEENSRKQRECDRLKIEIQQIKQLKEDMLYQLEFTIPKETRMRENAQANKITTLMGEIAEGQQKIKELTDEVASLQAENQKNLMKIDKLTDKQKQFDELLSQSTYYKNLCETLRVDYEISEAKIKGYEGVEKQLRETLDSLQAERNNSNSLRLSNVALQNKIDSLLKRLNFADEKAKMMRKHSISNVERYNEMVKQLSFIRELEDQNIRMRNILCALMKAKDLDDLRRLQSMVAEQRLVPSKATFEYIGTNISSHANLENEGVCRSFAEGFGTNNAHENEASAKNKMMEIESVSDDSDEERNESLLAIESQIFQTLQPAEETIQEIADKKGDFSCEHMELLYSILIESRAKDMANYHSLVVARPNRPREILRPFPIGNFFNQLIL